MRLLCPKTATTRLRRGRQARTIDSLLLNKGLSTRVLGATRVASVQKKKRSLGGPAEVLSSYQPGTAKCNWGAAAAGGNAADLVSQR